MSRRPKKRLKQKHQHRTFVIGVSLYLIHLSILSRYASIGIVGIEDDGTSRAFYSVSSEKNHNDPKKQQQQHHQQQQQQQQQQLVCDGVNSTSIIGDSVVRQWRYIDETIEEKFPNSRVSGGIFLYPRQASILTHLIQRIHAGRFAADNTKTHDTNTTNTNNTTMVTICETGYGSGHSMVLFREASLSIGPLRVVSFDKFDRPYQLPLWHHFNTTFRDAAPHLDDGGGDDRNQPQQQWFEFVEGNSCKTVPNRLPDYSCDVLHGSSLCQTDNIDLVEQSPCGVLLTTTAMGSLKDRQVYFGPTAQWRKLRDRNCIGNIVCFREDAGTLDHLKRDFIFAKQGSSHTGEFCVVVTTGRCQRGKKDSAVVSENCKITIRELLARLDLTATCPKYQIEPPI